MSRMNSSTFLATILGKHEIFVDLLLWSATTISIRKRWYNLQAYLEGCIKEIGTTISSQDGTTVSIRCHGTGLRREGVTRFNKPSYDCSQSDEIAPTLRYHAFSCCCLYVHLRVAISLYNRTSI